MRLITALFLSLLPALCCRADTPPLDHPTAWQPTIGSAWIATEVPADDVASVGFGMRPIRALTTSLRQGERGTEADFAVELMEARRFRPGLVLDSRGHGGSLTERLDSLLLGSRLGMVETSAGIARDGAGNLQIGRAHV